MKKMCKVSDFQKNNQNELNEMEQAQILGGKASCVNESYPTNWEGCSDTESWVYSEDGHRPLSGSVSYSDGTSSQLWP